MQNDCCKDVIVTHRKKRKYPRVTKRDFEILLEVKADIERIGRENDEIRLCLLDANL
jgi:hypothetical protein